MKKLLLGTLCALTTNVYAQATGKGSRLNISNNNYDFGGVHMNTTVTRDIPFQNSSDQPMTIVNIYDVPDKSNNPESHLRISYTKKQINPGKREMINITYEAKDNTGSFRHKVVMKTTSSDSIYFYINGAVIPEGRHYEEDINYLTPLGAIVGTIIINNM